MSKKNTNCNFEHIEDLNNINNVYINTNDAFWDRIRKYIKEVKNPYIFKIDDIKIKVEFLEDSKKSFDDVISKVISSS